MILASLLWSPPALAQEEAVEAEEAPEIHLDVSHGLRGSTAEPEGVPPPRREGDHVVTEDGQQIAFIDLDPEEPSSLPSAGLVAGVVGGGMLLLGVGASLMLLRTSSDEPESPA